MTSSFDQSIPGLFCFNLKQLVTIDVNWPYLVVGTSDWHWTCYVVLELPLNKITLSQEHCSPVRKKIMYDKVARKLMILRENSQVQCHSWKTRSICFSRNSKRLHSWKNLEFYVPKVKNSCPFRKKSAPIVFFWQ